MAGWRDIKKAARDRVHETFEVPAIYLTHLYGTPVRVNVRVHTKIAPTENEFTWPGASGFLEMTPKIIFRAEEVPKVSNDALVIVSPTEVYRIGVAEPVRDGFCVAECSITPQAECQTIVSTIPKNPEFEGISF
jgi:hypothetical protein